MSDDLVKRLRNTPNWMREGFQHWKDTVRTYDRAPFEAADRIEALEAERDSARNDALEAAAKVCRSKSDAVQGKNDDMELAYLRAEEAIRAMKKGPTTPAECPTFGASD